MSLLLLLRKLIKIVRADSAPRQIGLGLFVGVLVGLPPFGLASVLCTLLFFVLNANLGAFLLSFGLSGVASLALAPALNTLGERLLEAQSLRGFWGTALNLPVVCLCGLNRYIALGATVAALALGLVLFVVALIAVEPLRRSISRTAGRSSRLQRIASNRALATTGRLLFGKAKRKLDEIEGQKRWIRRGFVAPLLIMSALFALFWVLVGNRVAAGGVRLLASQTTGKDVELQSAEVGLLGGFLRVRSMIVAEPGGSADEGGARGAEIAKGEAFHFDLSPWEVFSRRFVVDELTVENLTYNADAEGMPRTPPEPTPGEPVDLGQVLEWAKSHEKQIRWALDKLDGVLEKSGEPPAPEAPGWDGRASWVYGTQRTPTFLMRSAGVRNLQLAWKEDNGPLTRLRGLDLLLHDLSSAPARHDQPIRFEAGGELEGKRLRLDGVFDVREKIGAGHSFKLSLEAPEFEASRLGLAGASGLELDIVARFAPGSGRPAEIGCEGSFAAPGLEGVQFALVGGDAARIDLTARGLDVASLTGVRRPSTLRVQRGTLDLSAGFGLAQGALDGAVSVSARGLELAPGSESTLAGLRADVVCKGLNALTREQPLALTFRLAGSPGAPRMSLDDAGVAELLTQVKAGLTMSGEKALAAEVDKRLSPLKEIAGAELARRQKELEERLGGAGLGGAGKGLGDKAGSILGGLLGEKKPPEKKKDP